MPRSHTFIPPIYSHGLYKGIIIIIIIIIVVVVVVVVGGGGGGGGGVGGGVNSLRFSWLSKIKPHCTSTYSFLC